MSLKEKMLALLATELPMAAATHAAFEEVDQRLSAIEARLTAAGAGPGTQSLTQAGGTFVAPAPGLVRASRTTDPSLDAVQTSQSAPGQADPQSDTPAAGQSEA